MLRINRYLEEGFRVIDICGQVEIGEIVNVWFFLAHIPDSREGFIF